MFRNRKVNKFLKKADSFFSNKNYDDALDIYDNILSKNPKNLHALYKKALILSIKKEYSESLNILDSILDITICVEAILLKGRIYIHLDNYSKAVNYYNMAADDSLFDFYKFIDEIGYYSIDNLFVFNGKIYEDIYLYLCDIILEKKDVPEIRLFKAYILSEIKHEKEALIELDHVLELMPNMARAYEIKASTLIKLKKYEDSLKTIEEGLRLNPNSSYLILNNAKAYYGLENFDDALNFCNKYISLENTSSDGYFLLSRILFKKGEYNFALENINIALKNFKLNLDNSSLDEFSYKWYSFKALILYKIGKSEDANNILECLFNKEPLEPRNYYFKAKILFDEGNKKESLKYLNKSLEIEPGCDEALKLKNQIENLN